MNYLQTFERSVRNYPEKPALVTDDGRSFSYTEFDERSSALAAALSDRLQEGRCATLANNGLPAVESMIAGQKRGIATVQLPYRGSPDELVRKTASADATGLVFDDANVETALRMLEHTDFEAVIHAGTSDVSHPAVESYESVLADAAGREPTPSGKNEYGVFYTSGTTSTPKAVLFDQEQMWLGSAQVVMEMGIDPTDVALVTTPWYHMVTTDAWILPHLQAGSTLVLHSKFEPDEALQLIEEHDVTGLLAVPTQLSVLADRQAEAGYDVETLDYIRTGGSIVSADLVQRASEQLTENVYNSYGMTEGGPNLTYAHPSVQAEHTGSVGKASYVWDIRVVETVPPSGTPDPYAVFDDGETGEILARSPGMCRGYLDNPAAEDELFVDGWIRTGDVAEVDEDGYLYIVDRVDNMIISGGENIYPQEVEQVLLEHDAVVDVGVFGVEDEYWGEVVVCAASVTGDVEETHLEEFCKGHGELANFKRPRRYALTTDELPRTDTGTLERHQVIQRFFGS